ncbi:LamG-like jellyroll fold domain-containing protein [Streptomyces sp. FXJ1.172]|uniref:LamG-like jellyroll fold domain-containing protein n=1 Tax=Streptomyces sp. FXJ1.172 TaxID=710705 RepID=UPI00099FED0C|nr:LamG-like jellyroll fold domain-containing protein [Streptomyces sp. FXJ1.172]WEO95811.1 LamG domain-containing protein [Streptomyces sp. FXJ1.172]
MTAVLAGTQQAALAVDSWPGTSGGNAPDQHWGSAAGRRHTASANATEAFAKGGHAGPRTGRGELPAQGETGTTRLAGAAVKLPKPGPVRRTKAPGAAVAKGFDPKRSKELTNRRGQRRRVFRNTDGTYTTRFYDEPVNFRAKDGSWKSIDTTLVPRDTRSGPGAHTMSVSDGAGWQTRSTQAPLDFAGTADAADVVRMRMADGFSVGYGVSGAAASPARADGSTVTYPEVRPHADLELLAGNDSVKETLVLKDKNAPTEWRFPLDLQGLTARPDGHGGIEFTDAEGRQRGWTPAGWMQDSHFAGDSHEGAISSKVTYGLDEENGRQVLVVKLDKDWLHDPGRVFPVRVDPSVQSFDSTSGTYVEYPYDQNFASDTVLKAGTYDGGSHKAAAFLHFSGVESTLKNAWILGADLALYNTWSQSCSARPVTVSPITSNWSESTTSKYPGPATGSSLASKSFAHGWRPSGTTTWSCGPAWESIKLGSAGRKLVDDWTHGRKKNYGLAVKASTTDSNGWKQFGSDDYPNGKPSLDITWTKYGATYAIGDFTTPVTATSQGVEKVTVTNEGQETWTKGGNYKLRYNLFDSTGKEITDSSKIAWTAMPQDVAPGDSVTLDAKIAPLDPATYTVQWTMDDYGTSRFTSAGVPGPAVKITSVNIPPQLTAESPGSGITADSLTPTLWAEGTDADDYPKSALQYTFEVCEVEGSNFRKNCKTGTRGSEQQWAVPSGWLSWGKAYAWYAYAYDGSATSARPGPALLTTQVPQPTVTSHLGGADDGKEIGTRAGNYVTAATDAAITTVGPELSVTRTYNSLDPRQDGAFGTGWSTSWDMKVREEPDTSTALVTLADGSQARFGENTDGTYTGPPGGSLTLAHETDGGWVLRERSGTTYHFLPGGELDRIADVAGREQTVTRATTSGGPVQKVTDKLSGRSLALTWTGSHVTSVTTSPVDAGTPGLTWTYTYTGDRLTTVCPPTSTTKCTVYGYGDGSVYRSGVLDAAPTSYWRLGESEGSAAVSESVSRTGRNEAVYRDVQLGTDSAIAGTTDTSVGFDGTNSVVELPADTLKAAAYPAIELWFKTSTPSGVLVGFQNAELGDKPTSWRPVLNIDGSGKLRGEFYLTGSPGATPIVSPQAVTDGQWHHVVLSAGATAQTLYLDGAKVGSLTGALTEQSRDYAYLGGGYGSTGWMGLATGTYRYKGEMDEVAFYDHPLDAATVAEHYAARTTIGQLTKVTLPSGRVHATAAYDPVGGRLTQSTDDNGGTWKVSAPSYSTASASYADTIERSGPTGYWRLGERAGAEAASPLGDALAGEYGDGVRLGSPGIFADGDDTSASFTGDGALEVPAESLGTQSAMSLELWFKTSTPGGVLVTNQDADFGDTPASWRPMLLIDADGKLRARFSGGASSLLSTDAVTDNTWHHVLLTGNQGAQALFVDGVYQAGESTGVDTNRFAHVFVGGGYSSTGWDGQSAGYRNFTGQIDEVAFYDKPLVTFLSTTNSDGSVTWRYVPWASRFGYTDTPNLHIQARRALVEGMGDQYRGVAVADAPAAYWRLGETSGTALHSEVGGTGLNATFRGDTGQVFQSKLDTPGVFGVGDDRAAHLGNTGHIDIPGSVPAGATDLSAEMWFRTSTPSGVLMSFQNAPLGQTPTSWRPVLNIDGDGKLRGEFYLTGASGATPIVSSQAVTDGQWHHVVLSASGNTQSLYLDGVKTGSLTGTITDQARDYAYLGAGYASTGWMGQPSGTYYFTGDIDEVALYRKGLTADQVSAHYRAQAESAASGLTNTVTVTDPQQHTSTTSYDALHGQRIVSHTDETGARTAYAYDIAGNLHTVTDPDGHSTVTGHDARGNIVSTTTCRDADSCWTSFRSSYLNASDPLDPRNDKPVSYSDPRSADDKDARYRTTYAYNSLGLLTATVRPDGSTAATTYTTGTEAAVGSGTAPAGLVLTRTTPGGARTSYRYYANGDVAEVTSPSGLVTKYTYDGLGRKTSETQVLDTFPNGVTTTYAYDAVSHIVTETGAAVKNEITGTTHTAGLTRSYDEDGNLLSETTQDTSGGDPARTTTYHYDTHGLNDSTTDAEQHTTHLEHDELGRVDGMTDPAGTHVTYTYTPRGQHATTVLNNWTGDPSGTVHDLTVVSDAYDPAGRLASTTDAMGATTAYTYYDDGLPATTTAKQVTQSDGSKHDIVLESDAYDPAGNLTQQVTGGGGTTRTFTVDALGRTTRTVFDPNGLNRVSTFGYDGDDRVKQQTRSITGAASLTVSSEYDAAGDATKQTVTDGTTTHITTHTYDDRGLPLTTVTPRGNEPGADASAFTTTNRYDELGRLVAQTAPAVAAEENGGAPATVHPTTLTGYDTFGDATDTKDARGQVTRATFDHLGRTTATTLPDYTPPGATTALTATTHTTYNALGLPDTVTDPLGRVTQYGYDQFGRLTSKTDPVADPADALTAQSAAGSGVVAGPVTGAAGGGVTQYSWTPTGLQLAATDPTGARTEATYDELGRQLTATTVERYPTTQNLTSHYTWDDAGDQTASTTPLGITTTAGYDPAGEVTSVTDPAGTTGYGYDGLGRRTETTDATHRRTTTSYDALGDVTATTDYGTGATALRGATAEFDADGNRTAVTDPQTKARTTYAYDALGRLTRQVEPVSDTKSVTTTFGYDAAGNRTRVTDGRGDTTVYTFTSRGLPESTVEPVTDADPSAADRTWTTVYDTAGQAVTELLPGGVRRDRTYDGLGHLTHETGTGAAATTDRGLGYDLAGRLTSVTAADGTSQNTYTYNDRGELLTASGPAGDASYTYDADGDMTRRKTTAGTTDYGYDSAGRLDLASDSITGSQVQYDFDPAGRPAAERYATKPAGATGYTVTAQRGYGYDALGRLTADTVTSPDGTRTVTSTTYGYDLDDRLTSKKTTGTAGAGDNSYTYDDAGRLTSWTKDGTTTPYVWDDAGNRTQAGTTTSTYDARNRQLTEGATKFTYTPRGTLASVDDGSGTTRTSAFDAFDRKVTDAGTNYTYDSLDRVQTRGSTAFTYDGGSDNLAGDGTTAYDRTPQGALLSFATGTTKQLAVTDQHTDLVAGLSADGTQVTGSTSYDPFGTRTATNGTTPAVGYQSAWTDPDSGAVDMAARWYQPGTGSFESRDSWQLDPSPSVQADRYTYADADPLNGTDPSGHCLEDACVIEGYAAVVGLTALAGWASQQLQHVHIGSWDDSGTTTGHYSHTGSYSLSNLFPNTSSLADALEAQASAQAAMAGYSSLTYTGSYGGGYAGSYGYTCTYSCRGTATYARPRVIPRPRPVIDQNPNNGPHPKPAPTRPKPTPEGGGNGGWKPGDGIKLVVSALKMLQLAHDDRYSPEGLLQQLPDPYLNESRNPNGDSDNRNMCDDQAGENATGNIVYLPRERFRPGPDGCRATGIVGDFSGPQDMADGSRTAWNNDCESGMITPPDYWKLPPGRNRARGHLAGCQFGGSGTDLRNLVPLHRAANSPVMSSIENRIAGQIRVGQAVHYEVTPVYADPRSGIPSLIHMEAHGNRGMDVDCYVINSAAGKDPVCSSQTYER